jgi:tetratricopeptide (TPR) repeat protein
LAFAYQSSVAADRYSQAETMIRNHRWDEGLGILRVLLAQDTDNLKALNLAGLAFTGKGDVQQADQYFRKVLRIDPGFVPALKNLGINEFNANQPKEAERLLLLAAQQAPEDPVINLYLGQLFYGRQNFTSAASAFSKAGPFLARNPDLRARLGVSYLSMGEAQKTLDLLDSLPPAGLSAESQFMLGAELAQAGLFEPAVPYLQAAQNDPRFTYDAGFDLGLCSLNLKQYPRAIDALRAAAGRRETAEVYNLLAEAYEGDKQTQPAVDALRKAIALAPEDQDNYLDFASLCMDHQDFAAGLKVLNVGLQIHPTSDRLLFERAILYAMQDNFQLAEKDFQQVSQLAPEKNATYKGLGVLYLEKGDAAKAVQVLHQRLQEKPDDPDLLYLLGEARLRSGAHAGDASYIEAQSAFEKSIQLNPRLCLPHVALGKMDLEQDRFADAVTQLEQARTIDPKEASTYWQLAMAYRKLGQPDKQREALSTLKALNDAQRSGSRVVKQTASISTKTP